MPTLNVEPLTGTEVQEGDQILRVNTTTGEAHWSAPITHFDPQPKTSFAAIMFGPGVRIAWMGDIPFGPLDDAGFYEVHRPCTTDAKAA